MGTNQRGKREVVLGVFLLVLLVAIGFVSFLLPSGIDSSLDQEITGAVVTSTLGSQEDVDLLAERVKPEEKSLISQIFSFFSSKDSGSLTGAVVGGGGSLDAQANCGGVTACSCGDTLTSSRTLDENDNFAACQGLGLNIGADNLVLDCSNISIVADPGIGVEGIQLESNNFTMTSCNITGFKIGVNMSTVDTVTFEWNNFTDHEVAGISNNGYIDNVTIQNNLFLSNGSNAIKFNDSGSLGILILDNEMYGHTSTGILFAGFNGTIARNVVYENGNDGIDVSSGGNYTTIENNTVNDHAVIGIKFSGPSHLLLTGNNLTNNSLFFNDVLHSHVELGTIASSKIILSGQTEDVNIQNVSIANFGALVIDDLTADSTENNLLWLNDFGLINISSTNLSASDQISDSLPFVLENNTVGVEVSSNYLNLNTSSQIAFYGLSYGQTPYLNKDGVRCDDTAFCNVSYSGTTLLANVTGFSNYSTSAVPNSAPTHDAPTVNSSLATNLTTENLTVHNHSTADVDSDVVKNIYDWRLNGSSIAMLNMPFEGVNDTSYNNTQDYTSFSFISNDNGVEWLSDGGFDGKGAYNFSGTVGVNISDHNVHSFGNVTDDQPFTVMAWIYMRDATNFAIVSKVGSTDAEWAFHTRSNDKLQLLLYDNTNTNRRGHQSSSTVTSYENQWVHVASTYDGRGSSPLGVNLYLNGENISTEGGSVAGGYSAMHNQSDDLTIGSLNTFFADGIIDEVLIFNRTLSADQVHAIYSNQSNLLVSQETSLDDNWTATVTPNDGSEDGETKESGELVIIAETPDCITITEDYNMSENIVTTGGCFVVNASHVTVDGAGHSLSSNASGIGINVGNSSNVTIQHFASILNFSQGIFVDELGHNVTVYNSTINSTEGNMAVSVGAKDFLLNSSVLDCNCSGDTASTIRFDSTTSRTQITDSSLFAHGEHPTITIGPSSGHALLRNYIYSFLGNAIELDTQTTLLLVNSNDLLASENVISGGSDSNYTLNNISSFGVAEYSALLLGGSRNTFTSNNVSSEGHALEIGNESVSGYDNQFFANNFSSTNSAVFFFGNGTRTSFVNDTLSKDSATANVIELYHGFVNFTNVSFDKDNVSFSSDSNASLQLIWYVDVNVSNSTGDPVDTASVFVYNNSNVTVASGSTDGDGFVYGLELIEGVVNKSAWYLQTPHQVEARKVGFDASNTSANLTILESNTLQVIMNQTVVASSVCGNLTDDYTFTEDVIVNGSCFVIETSHLIVDFAGFSLIGNSSGIAFQVGNTTNVTVVGGVVQNFSSFLSAVNVSYLNLTNLSLLNFTEGILFSDVNHSLLEGSSLQSLDLGLNISLGYNNSVYNNIFNASSENVYDDGNNNYNISYSCLDTYSSIIGRNCSGGNYWNDYAGLDDGSGASLPHNVSNDSIGDTSLPYTNDDLISTSGFGDYMPLLYCSESWVCGSWSTCSSSSQTRTCVDSNSCGTELAKPIESQSCSSGGSSSGGGGSSSPQESQDEESDSEAESEQSESDSSKKSDAENIKRINDEVDDPLQEDGAINAEIPSKEEILDLDEVKKKLVVKEIVQEKVASGTLDSLTKSDSSGTSSSSSSSSSSSGNSGAGSKKNTFGKEKSDEGTTVLGGKKVAVIDDPYDARRSADLAREVLTVDLENQGDKAMVLVPIARQEGEENVRPVLTRKVYSGAASENAGLKVSSLKVSDDMLKASLGAVDHIVIDAGSSEKVQLELSAGVGTSSTETILLSMYPSDGELVSEEAVLTQKIELNRDVVTVSSVVPHEEEESIDVFALIATQDTGREEVLQGSGSVVDESVGDDTFAVYGGQYIEISLEEVSSLKKIPLGSRFAFFGETFFADKSKVLFTDVYGPYNVHEKLDLEQESGIAEEDKEGFVFAQKFSYDAEMLGGGEYILTVDIYDSQGRISEQSFLLDLDSSKDLHETVESEIVKAASAANVGSPATPSATITGAVVGEVSGAVSFSEIATVAYQQTEETAYIIYQDVLPNQEAQIAFTFLLVLVGLCLLTFVFGPARPVLLDTVAGAKEGLDSASKDLNA